MKSLGGSDPEHRRSERRRRRRRLRRRRARALVPPGSAGSAHPSPPPPAPAAPASPASAPAASAAGGPARLRAEGAGRDRELQTRSSLFLSPSPSPSPSPSLPPSLPPSLSLLRARGGRSPRRARHRFSLRVAARGRSAFTPEQARHTASWPGWPGPPFRESCQIFSRALSKMAESFL